MNLRKWNERNSGFILRGMTVLLVLLLVPYLAGCGLGRAKDEPVLRWVTYSASGPSMDAKEVIAAANAYSRDKIGIAVDLEFQPSDKMNLMMASGE